MQSEFSLGWEEWIALPELDLPAIKAKIDTGARTSALHALAIEEIGTPERRRVRFEIQPVPGRTDLIVSCIADVVAMRDVTSSNGETESRYVIRTPIRIADRQWSIEITLTNRENMAYRMLLGRQAIGDDVRVDPQASFLQPQLSYRAYAGNGVPKEANSRPLSIAILSRRPENAGNRRLVRQGELRGHTVSIIDRRRVSLFIAHKDPAILLNGLPLPHIDVIIFRAGRAPSTLSLAISRQMEAMGALALNPASALSIVADSLVLRQTLAAAGVPVPEIAVNPNDLTRKEAASEHRLADSTGVLRMGAIYRFAVIGNRALAVIRRDPSTPLEQTAEWQAANLRDPALSEAKAAAEAAARAVGLGLVAVDLVTTKIGPLVVGMTANVSIATFDRLAGAALAEAIIIHIENVMARTNRMDKA
ncbi:MAG: RimK/LysX family protein [Hyphomicrobiaceae bacterium]